MQKHTTIPLPFDEYPFLCSLFDVIKSQKMCVYFQCAEKEIKKNRIFTFRFLFLHEICSFLAAGIMFINIRSGRFGPSLFIALSPIKDHIIIKSRKWNEIYLGNKLRQETNA